MNNLEETRLYTLVAFLLGMFLSVRLSSTEQNALGNWLMLVAQTLCTNGSYSFNNDWEEHTKNIDIHSLLSNLNESIDKILDII